MARSGTTQKVTRIQREKTQAIMDAALDVFSRHGFRGSTIDMIAKTSGFSKPNILYYFDSKEAIFAELINRLLKDWLEPLIALDDHGEPVDEVCAYVRRKLDLAQAFPRESRLFANEILQGAPHILPQLAGPLRDLVDQKAQVMDRWITEGRLAPCDPVHVIFMIWASTQHYADFDVQVRAVLNTPESDDHFQQAAIHLDQMFRRMLTPA